MDTGVLVERLARSLMEARAATAGSRLSCVPEVTFAAMTAPAAYSTSTVRAVPAPETSVVKVIWPQRANGLGAMTPVVMLPAEA